MSAMYGVLAYVLSVGEMVSGASNSAKYGTKPVLELLEGAARGTADLIHGVAGGINWMKNVWGLVPIAELRVFLNTVTGGIAGAFGFVGDIVLATAGVFEFMQGQSGLEAAAFLVGLFIMILGLWLLLSGILEGEVLALPLYEDDVFFTLGSFFMGTGLTIYSVSSVGGSAMVAGISIASTFFGIQADEAEYVVMGVFSGLFGFPMIFTTIGFGPVEAGFASAVALVGLIFGSDLLETRIAPQIAGE